jgi:site-specific DNA-methyltransferase (adenine-specific)
MIVEQMLKNAQTPLLHIADVSGSAFFQGDCLEIMPLIPDKSVQLILADLPYGTTACKWDSILPFDKLWEEYERIITDNGAIVLTASQPFTSALVMSNPKLFRYELIWDKVNRYTGYANANKMPLRRHENIVVFYKKLPTFNKQLRDGKPFTYSRKKNKEEYLGKNGLTDRVRVNHGKHNPCSIIEIKGDNKKETGLHPTQKPLELMKYLISTYSNENDMVLDNTMGSGTTCLGAKELNRKFIGIEKEANYYEIACRRCGF